MRRSIPAVLLVVVGLLLLLDFLVVNPTLGVLSGALVELVVILFAAAALLGAAALAVRHGRSLAVPGEDRVGSVAGAGGNGRRAGARPPFERRRE